MFHFLIYVEVRHLKKYLHFILQMPNCAADGCSNHSTKNSNIFICSRHFEKKTFQKRFEGKYDYEFFYAAIAAVI